MEMIIEPRQNLWGEIAIPGDKSISHRSIIFGSIAEGETRVRGFLESEDCLRTLTAFQQMGVPIKKLGPGEYLIQGVGLHGLEEPHDVLDCGNSGTTMRLLTGLLAPQSFYSVLTGDDSLRQRPMSRVLDPLTQMGAKIWGRQKGYAPLSIQGSSLQRIEYQSPVASAQVKSALLLAGLYTEDEVIVEEPGYSRDHTERMLQRFGVDLKKVGKKTHLLEGAKRLLAQEVNVPGDISSAAFFIVAGLIVPGSHILLKNIGFNPTRSGLIKVVQEMGGKLQLENKREICGEPMADIRVKYSSLQGISIAGELIPTLIDELPIIALLATQATGQTHIRDAGELRVKETDRIAAVVQELTKLGANIQELADGMVIMGSTQLKGNVVADSYGDHRIAMMLTIAGLIALDQVIIENSQVIQTSFPGFIELLETLF